MNDSNRDLEKLVEELTLSRVIFSEFEDENQIPYLLYNYFDSLELFAFQYLKILNEADLHRNKLTNNTELVSKLKNFCDSAHKTKLYSIHRHTVFINDDVNSPTETQLKELKSIFQTIKRRKLDPEESKELFRQASSDNQINLNEPIDFFDTGKVVVPSADQLRFASPFIEEQVRMLSKFLSTLEADNTYIPSLKLPLEIDVKTFQYALSAFLLTTLREGVSATSLSKFAPLFHGKKDPISADKTRTVYGHVLNFKKIQEDEASVKEAIKLLEDALKRLKSLDQKKYN